MIYYGFQMHEQWIETDDPDQKREIFDENASLMADSALFALPAAAGLIFGLPMTPVMLTSALFIGWDVAISGWNLHTQFSAPGKSVHWLFSDMFRPLVDHLFTAFHPEDVEGILNALRVRLQLPNPVAEGELDPATREFQDDLMKAHAKQLSSCELKQKAAIYSMTLQDLARRYLIFLQVGHERFGARTPLYFTLEEKLEESLFEQKPALFPVGTALLSDAKRFLEQKANACAPVITLQKTR
jgi:hypothetical protein